MRTEEEIRAHIATLCRERAHYLAMAQHHDRQKQQGSTARAREYWTMYRDNGRFIAALLWSVAPTVETWNPRELIQSANRLTERASREP